MKSRLFISLVFIMLTIFMFGCGSEAIQSEQVSTPLPTYNPTPTEIESTEVEIEENEEVIPEPEEAQETGPVRIGINSNSVSPLVIHEEESLSIFKIELATEIVTRLFGSEALIEWVPITSQERFTSLADGQIDMLVRSTLHTVSREEQALFSGVYLLTGNSFLVFKDDGFSSVEDLDGRNVAVVPQMEEPLSQAANELGYTFNAVIGEDFAETRGLLGFDRSDALYQDWLLLASVIKWMLFSWTSSLMELGNQYTINGLEFQFY